MRARATLEAEIWVLRQQINVLRRAAPKRQSFGIFDRLIFVSLYRLFPKACDALAIVKPDTIIPWHRAGFRAYWRWKSLPVAKWICRTADRFDPTGMPLPLCCVRRAAPPTCHNVLPAIL